MSDPATEKNALEKVLRTMVDATRFEVQTGLRHPFGIHSKEGATGPVFHVNFLMGLDALAAEPGIDTAPVIWLIQRGVLSFQNRFCIYPYPACPVRIGDWLEFGAKDCMARVTNVRQQNTGADGWRIDFQRFAIDSDLTKELSITSLLCIANRQDLSLKGWVSIRKQLGIKDLLVPVDLKTKKGVTYKRLPDEYPFEDMVDVDEVPAESAFQLPVAKKVCVTHSDSFSTTGTDDSSCDIVFLDYRYWNKPESTQA